MAANCWRRGDWKVDGSALHRRVDRWTEAQKRAYVIADNKLALNAGWDEALLTLEFGDPVKDAGFDLGLTGFGAIRGGRAVRQGEPQAWATLDENGRAGAAGGAVHPGGRRVDLWVPIAWCAAIVRTRCRCLEGARRRLKPMLMVTDPPYGVNYDPEWRARAGVNLNAGKLGHVDNDDRADWREAWALFEGDVAYVWHAGRYAGTVEQSLLATGFEIRAQIIWCKDRFALSRGDYHWQHEPSPGTRFARGGAATGKATDRNPPDGTSRHATTRATVTARRSRLRRCCGRC